MRVGGSRRQAEGRVRLPDGCTDRRQALVVRVLSLTGRTRKCAITAAHSFSELACAALVRSPPGCTHAPPTRLPPINPTHHTHAVRQAADVPRSRPTPHGPPFLDLQSHAETPPPAPQWDPVSPMALPGGPPQPPVVAARGRGRGPGGQGTPMPPPGHPDRAASTRRPAAVSFKLPSPWRTYYVAFTP